MQEIAFSIPVSGTIRIDDNVVTITVIKAETTITFEPEPTTEERISLPKGVTLFDVMLDTARKFVASNGRNEFSAADLYHEARGVYPNLKRNSWTAHAIASAPNHPSHKHYGAKRDYFHYRARESIDWMGNTYLARIAAGDNIRRMTMSNREDRKVKAELRKAATRALRKTLESLEREPRVILMCGDAENARIARSKK